jgi:ribosomal protein S6
MSKNNMPAVEAENVEVDALEQHSYELAFHVLPTIAEGEVSAVVDSIKAAITKNAGEIFDEESPERFELAYEVVKHLEGKNRKFRSAYFGWIRFKALGEAAVAINAEVDTNNVILRHLLIKLTRVEEENPFRFHEAMRDQKMVTNFGDEEVVAEEAVSEEPPSAEAEEEASPQEEEKSV